MIKKIVATKYTVTFTEVEQEIAKELEEYASSRGVKPTINPRTPPIHEMPPLKKNVQVAKEIKQPATKKVCAKKTVKK
ncbi:MAG TPA: hypothetical protein PLT47_00070 [Bacteroidales bacterium]|nr:hypothetical protein [Bacteroidales bacterium]HQI69113.1 hypothetical protein [Bacteroidales bacterium]